MNESNEFLNGQGSYRTSNAIFYIIPQEEETRVDLLNIDQNTKEDVRRLYRFIVAQNWQCNTIANAIIENMIRTLSLDLKNTRNGNALISLYDMMDAYVTVKRDDDAEKEGNINIAFSIGKRVEGIITDNVTREDRKYEYISPEIMFGSNPESPLTKKMELLDKIARKELNDKYGILLPTAWMAMSIGYIFIENLYRELVNKIILMQKPSVSINFNDNIEFHATRKSDGIVINLRPGMNAKLLIKSDELTENDDGDDED